MTWQEPASNVLISLMFMTNCDSVSVTIIKLILFRSISSLNCAQHSFSCSANICYKSFICILSVRLPSSWHVTFVKKYGMDRKQKLHWLSCDTEGRDWLRLRTPEGGREFAAPTQTGAAGDSSLAAATRHSHNPRLVSQQSARTRGQRTENRRNSDPLRERGVMKRNKILCWVDEEKSKRNYTSEVGMIRFGGRIVRLEDTGQ